VLARLSAAGARVYIVAGIPEVGYDVPSALGRIAWNGRDLDIAPTRAEFSARQKRSLDMLDALARESGAVLLRADLVMCGADRCRLTAGGRPLYFDDDHLNRTGAIFLAPGFTALGF
jgi:hypothetical protein